MSKKLAETSVDKTNKTHHKVVNSKFMIRMSNIHTNRPRPCMRPKNYATAQSLPRLRSGPAAFTPWEEVLSTFHIMDPRTADPLLKDSPDAEVHRIQIRLIGWPYPGDELWRFSLQQCVSVTCMMWFHWRKQVSKYMNCIAPKSLEKLRARQYYVWGNWCTWNVT